jgi:hypothetical protein
MTRSTSLRLAALLSLLAVTPLFAAIAYPPPTVLTGGSGPSSVAVADFNQDCAPDFATADQFASTVTLRFGNGSGSFPTLGTVTGLLTPVVIVSGDFNEDGAPDLAVGNHAGFGVDPVGHTISILLNHNDGSGTFTALAPAASPATDGMTNRLVAADINEDGHLDLLAIDAAAISNGVRFYAGDGTGHFAAPAVISTDTHTPNALVAVDLNADGNLDLAVTTGDATGIFLGNGNGTFGAPAYTLYPDPIVGADGASHIAAADIDHDGDIDLATTAGNFQGGVTILRNNGDATFTRSRFQINSVVTNPVFIALADLDGDGNIDVVSANQSGCTPDGSNLSARPGHGDGTFGAIVPLSVGYGPTCLNSHWQPNAVAAVDLNCDGAADLIVPNMNTAFTSILLTPGASDTSAPVITAPLAVSVSSSGASCSAVVSDALLGHASAHDNCSSCVVITRSGVPAGNVFPAGTTIVTYTASDGHGNTSSATQAVTVTDGAPPVITAPADVTVTAGAGCVATVAPGTPSASDGCSSVTVTSVRSDGQPLASAFPLGTTTITWTATDTSGNHASAAQQITVTAPPPVIAGGTASPAALWPPNHNMTPVTVSYSITGGCGSSSCSITSVTSNESVNGTGDGDVAPDWQIVDAHHVTLRAERSGNNAGRVYTITITCTDEHGASVTKTVPVTVSHN